MPIQPTNHNPTIGDMNEIRENNTMFMNNEETKTPVGAQLAARIPDVGSASADLGVGGLKSALQRGIGVALVALFLAAPGTALADDECGAQIDSGNPETITCAPGDYASGITYSSDGDLTLQVTDDSDHLDVFETGIGVTGTGGDSVFWDSSTFVNNDIRGTGIVLDYASGTGAIDILIGGDVRAQDDATHAIRAISGSGDITIQTNEGGRVFGGDYGIQAETGGAGALTLNATDSIDINSTTGVAAIDATTGTGALTVNILSTGSSDSISGRLGNAIRTNAGGNVEINVGDGRSVTASFQSDEAILDLTAVGDITLNNAGSINSSGPAIVAAGDTFIINNDGLIRGSIEWDMSGAYTFNNNAGASWDARLFGVTGKTGDLGAGTLNNAGTIELSSGNFISALGTAFTGSGDSTLELRVALDGTGQPDCANPTIGSCLDLSGGSTAGQTSILINTFSSGPFTEPVDKPVNAGVVLVDVDGGTSAAEHFVLDPDSGTFSDSFYAMDPIYGAVLDTGGLFDYALLYNPNTQQHLLSSVPQTEALQYAALIQESLSVWHTSSDAIAGRQADLRDGGSRGGWVRVINESTDRDFKPRVTTHGNTFDYEHGYSLDTKALIAGYDLSADDNHVFGVHLGFMDTKLEHDDSATVDETDFPSSITFGTYMGWWNESGLTLDGTLNVNLLDIEHNVSSEFEDIRSNVLTAGIRAEAGWRMPISEAFYVQPLATLAYAYADIENLDMRDYDASFEDTTSARGALGVRLGGETGLNAGQFDRIGYWLTARAWEETSEDARVEFKTDGDPLAIEDDYSGSFEEVGLGVSLSTPEDDLSVYLSGGLKSGDLIDSNYNVSVGARLNW